MIRQISFKEAKKRLAGYDKPVYCESKCGLRYRVVKLTKNKAYSIMGKEIAIDDIESFDIG